MMKPKHKEGKDWLGGILHSDCTTFPKISGTKLLSKAHCLRVQYAFHMVLTKTRPSFYGKEQQYSSV